MKKKIALIALGIILIVVIILAGVFFTTGGKKPQKENTQSGEAGNSNGNSQNNGTGNQEGGSEDNTGEIEQDYLIDLGDNLYIHDLVNVEGTFIEDGSDEAIDSVAAITVENRGDKTLQLANIYLYVEDVEYAFSLTTLPPGKTAMIQESGKQTFPKMEKLPSAKTEHVAFFREEPSLQEDVFEITASAYSIVIKNKTDADIAGPIYVYYKTNSEEYYQGGITYRVQIPALAAGESYTAYAGHFYGEESQVMYVDYAK